MAAYCRSKVAGDVVFGQRAYGVEFFPLTKFGDSRLSRSCVIRPIFYKIANYCRPEVAGDVISGQRAFGVEVIPLTKFGDPSSNRLAGMHRCDRRQTTDRAMTIAHPMHSLQLWHRWAKNHSVFVYRCNIGGWNSHEVSRRFSSVFLMIENIIDDDGIRKLQQTF